MFCSVLIVFNIFWAALQKLFICLLSWKLIFKGWTLSWKLKALRTPVLNLSPKANSMIKKNLMALTHWKVSSDILAIKSLRHIFTMVGMTSDTKSIWPGTMRGYLMIPALSLDFIMKAMTSWVQPSQGIILWLVLIKIIISPVFFIKQTTKIIRALLKSGWQ